MSVALNQNSDIQPRFLRDQTAFSIHLFYRKSEVSESHVYIIVVHLQMFRMAIEQDSGNVEWGLI